MPAPKGEAFDHVIRHLTVPRTYRSPRIEGRMREQVWNRAASATGFVLRDDPERSALAETSVRIMYDRDYLYLGIRAKSPTGRFWWDDRPSGGAPPEAERVELYFDPEHDHRRYYAFLLYADGSAYAYRHGYTLYGEDNWVARGTRRQHYDADNLWIVEIAIAFRALGLSPAPARVIGFQAVRHASRCGEGPSQWSPSSATGTHPEAFGDLILDGRELVLERVSWPALALGRNGVSLTVSNRSERRQTVAAEVQVESPFVTGESVRGSEVAVEPGGQAELQAPFELAHAGKSELKLALVSKGTREDAYGSYPLEPRPIVRAEDWGKFLLTPAQRVLGSSGSLVARLQSLHLDHVPDHAPGALRLQLVSEHGLRIGLPQERSLSVEELGALDLHASWDYRGLAPGRYWVELQAMQLGETPVLLGRCAVFCQPEEYERLGFEQVERLARRAAEEPTPALVEAEPLLEIRLQRARREYEERAFTAAELSRCSAWARALLAEAVRLGERAAKGQSPLEGWSGTLLLAYRSGVDDSLQPYAVTVPPRHNPRAPCGLIVSLHGWDWSNRPFSYPKYERDSLAPVCERNGWLAVRPWGRGNNDFRGSGETDLFDVIEDLARHYAIDRDRIYLQGVSMGGRGAWRIALRHPDRFAGLVPIAGAALASMWGVWVDEPLALNLQHLPTYILHGEDDYVVPVTDSRRMARLLHSEACPAHYYEFNAAGHEGFSDLYRELFAKLAPERRVIRPRTVRFRTDSVKWDRAYWVRVGALEREGHYGTVQAAVTGAGEVKVTTQGLLELFLNLGPWGAEAQEVILDGRRFAAGNVGEFAAHREPGKPWSAGPLAEVSPRKCNGLQGPLRDATNSRFLLVPGTQGADPALVNACHDLAREAEETWDDWMHGTARVKRDVEVTDEDLAESNVLLYGGPACNAVTARLAAGLPLPGGREAAWPLSQPRVKLAYRLIYPTPGQNGRYTLITAAPNADALRAIGQLGSPLALMDVDYVVATCDEQGEIQVQLEGVYDWRWQWPSVQPGLVVSNGRWKASSTVGEGWQQPEYDDSGWAPAQTTTRTDHDNATWKFGTVIGYQRLVQTFEPGAVALWCPEPDRPHAACHFRRRFDLPAVPRRAELLAWAADDCEVFVNGQSVALLRAGEDLRVRELASDLWRQGANVLAAAVNNTQPEQGFLCQVKFEF